MILKNVQVTNYKSISDSGAVPIEDRVTVLVGKNESGKTGFLEALHKSRSQQGAQYDYVDDYPRRQMTTYRRRHEKENYDNVAVLTFEISSEEAADINNTEFGGAEVISAGHVFRLTVNYGNGREVWFHFDKFNALKGLQEGLENVEFASDVFSGAKSLNDVLERIDEKELTDEHPLAQFQKLWATRAENCGENWDLIEFHVWQTYLSPHLPEFLYFDDYCLLPGKVNLKSLKQRVDSDTLDESDQTVLGLFDLADITLEDVLADQGYEQIKAQLEAIGLHTSDKVFQYWKQNTELDVEFDLKADPHDIAPYNSGINLYIRIKSRRHGVTIPFDQRSKGFIWFFSFMVWFDAINARADTDGDLILLLDEPGLSLHALAQRDFLEYIDKLSEEHQTIYTTHSPFMVDDGRLEAVRVVEDTPESGTTVTPDIAGSGREAIFPLQAALGYDIAQNLFVGQRNLLVEGISDLVILQHLNACLESLGRKALTDCVFVPVGGLEKVATFVALFGANQLDLVVLHDNAGNPDQRLEDLIRQKLLQRKRVLNYSMFAADDTKPADLEDLFTPTLYVKAFNQTYGSKLGGNKLKVGDLGQHPRIVERINQWLRAGSIELRPSGGFNHYLVAQQLVLLIKTDTLKDDEWDRVEKMFNKVNSVLAADS